MKHTANALIMVLLMILAGCSSLRPLASQPPATVIALSAPVIIKHAFGSETILPAGDYRATLEDQKGYYYVAPAKLIRNDRVGRQLDGGLYMLKDSTVLGHYYVIGRKHATRVYPLKVRVQYEMKP